MYIHVLQHEIYSSIQRKRKEMIGHHTCLREIDDLPLWRAVIRMRNAIILRNDLNVKLSKCPDVCEEECRL